MTPGTLVVVNSFVLAPLFNRLEPYSRADRYLERGDIVLVVYMPVLDPACPSMVLVLESGRTSWAYAEDFSEEEDNEP